MERVAVGSSVTDLEVVPALTKIEKAIDDQPLLKTSDIFTGLAGLIGVLAGALLADKLAETRLSQSHRLARELQLELWQIGQLRLAADEAISLTANTRNYAELLQAGENPMNLRKEKVEIDVAAHKLVARLRLLTNGGLTEKLKALETSVKDLIRSDGPFAKNEGAPFDTARSRAGDER